MKYIIEGLILLARDAIGRSVESFEKEEPGK